MIVRKMPREACPTPPGEMKGFPGETMFFTCNRFYLGKIYLGKFSCLRD